MKAFFMITFAVVLLNSNHYLLAQAVAFEGEIYTLDQQHSLMDFTARHKGFGRVRGTFNEYQASMYFVEGKLESSSVSAVINVASLDTQNPGRDEHIREVFFDAAKYPHMLFQSTRIEQEEGVYIMYGELSIKETTREVKLPIDIITLEGMDQWENKRIVLETSITINRRDFNVVYDNAFWDAVVSDEIVIDISFGGYHYNARNSIFPWRSNSIGTLIRNGVAEQGLDLTLKQVAEIWNSESKDYNLAVNHFHRAGLALAQGGQIEEGITVLQLAIELHASTAEATDISDLYTTIAEIAARNQQFEKAREATRMALEVAPLNTTALELSRQLGGGGE